jgi:alkylation response protein AidB-like acyl-CoA dehydrogenase
MDFAPTEEQRAILDAVDALLARHAGAARAIELARKGGYDEALDAALGEAGFDALAADAGLLDAALLVEAVAHAGGVAAVGAGVLVAPLAAGRRLPGPVALATARGGGPVRFAAHARSLLVLDGDDARVVELRAGEVSPVRSSFGFPFGAVPDGVRARGTSLGPGSGARLARAWRLALALEAAGAMRAALDVTVAYVRRRRQFGRAIGSFQAVQHRLAECFVWVEGARWLAFEAAWRGAPDEAVAAAAAHALAAAGRVFEETHQLSGAMGYTREHDLHVFSMRLPALRQELGGLGGHRRALARTRWGAGARGAVAGTSAGRPAPTEPPDRTGS